MRNPLKTYAVDPPEAEAPPAMVRVWQDRSGDVAEIPYDELPDWQARGYSLVVGNADLTPRTPESTGLGLSPLGMLVTRGVSARARIATALGTTAPRRSAEIPFNIVDLEDVATLAEQVAQLRSEVAALTAARGE